MSCYCMLQTDKMGLQGHFRWSAFPRECEYRMFPPFLCNYSNAGKMYEFNRVGSETKCFFVFHECLWATDNFFIHRLELKWPEWCIIGVKTSLLVESTVFCTRLLLKTVLIYAMGQTNDWSSKFQPPLNQGQISLIWTRFNDVWNFRGSKEEHSMHVYRCFRASIPLQALYTYNRGPLQRPWVAIYE